MMNNKKVYRMEEVNFSTKINNFKTFNIHQWKVMTPSN